MNSVKATRVEGKGRCVVADREFQQGDIIIQEKELFQIPNTVPQPKPKNSTSLRDDISAAVEQLTHAHIARPLKGLEVDQLKRFRHSYSKEDSDLSHFLCNFYELCPVYGGYPTAFGFFHWGSLVNHSCKPNCLYVWDEETQTLRFMALGNISKGEEIVACYLPEDSWMTSTERRTLLWQMYNFHCICERCTNANDNDIERLNKLHGSLCTYLFNDNTAAGESWNHLCNAVDAVTAAMEYCKRVERELRGKVSLSSYVEPRLSFALRVAAECARRTGNNQVVLDFRIKARRVDSICFGASSVHVGEQERLFDERLQLPAASPECNTFETISNMSLLTFAKQFECSSSREDDGKSSHSGSLSRPLPKTTAENVKLPFSRIVAVALALVLSRHMSQPTVEFDFAEDPFILPQESTSKIRRVSTEVDEEQNLYGLASSIASTMTKEKSYPDKSRHIVLVMHLADIKQANIETKIDELRVQTQRELVLWVARDRSHVHVYFSHISEFPEPYVTAVIDHLVQTVCNLFQEDPKRLRELRSIEMLSDEEQACLRKESSPRRPLSCIKQASMHQSFRSQALRTPDAVALVDADHQNTTFFEAEWISNCMSNLLASEITQIESKILPGGRGIEDATVIAIMLSRSPNIVISQLACWKAGFAVVILDPLQPIARNQFIVEDSAAALILIDDLSDLSAWRQYNTWKFAFDAVRETLQTSPAEVLQVKNTVNELEHFHRLAWVMYTSGSTGTPKGARHSHGSIATPLHSFGAPKGSRALLFINPVATAASMAIWTFLLYGRTVCIPSHAQVTSDLAACIRDFSTDEITITPSALLMVKPLDVPSLRSITMLGESIPRSTVVMWSRTTSVRLHYGSTEVGSHGIPYCDEIGHLPPVLPLPISDSSFYVLQPQKNKICPYFVPGEICFSATNMMSGYVSHADEAKLHDHPFPDDAGHTRLYRTGDMGVLIGNSRFAILGRIDHQMKIDGNRIEPGEVEHLVREFSPVKVAKLLLVKDIRGRSMLICCVVLKEIEQGSKSEWDELTTRLQMRSQERLPRYMIPHRWLKFEKSLPTTITGKIDLKTLELIVLERLEEDEEFNFENVNLLLKSLSPSGAAFTKVCLEMLTDSAEESLSEIERAKVMFKPFLYSGGTSLIAMRILHEMKNLGIILTLETLYSASRLVDISTSKLASVSLVRPISHKSQRFPLPPEFDSRRDDIEAIFATSMLQGEMLMLSLRNSRDWVLYRYFDLSKFDCSHTQLQESLQLLTESKPILRTVIVPAQATQLPPSNAAALATMQLTSQQDFVHVVMKAKSSPFSFSPHFNTTEPGEHFLFDSARGWGLGKPLWRACWLEKPRLLAIIMSHTLVDQWCVHLVPEDLHEILTAIVKRDSGGGKEELEMAIKKACRPSSQSWIENVYEGKGLDGESPSKQMQDGTKIWKEIMTGSTGKPLPDTNLRPVTKLPPVFPTHSIKNSSYPKWCKMYGVTSGVLFNMVFALTLARVVDELNAAEELTYYRYNSNRDTDKTAWDAEGCLISMSPIRVPVSNNLSILEMAKAVLAFTMRTHGAHTFYVDEPLKSGGGLGKRRPYGNVLLNHMVLRSDVDHEPPKWPDAAEGSGFFSDIPAFLALEFHIIEADPKNGTRVDLNIYSLLQENIVLEILGQFEPTLNKVIGSEPGMTIEKFLSS